MCLPSVTHIIFLILCIVYSLQGSDVPSSLLRLSSIPADRILSSVACFEEYSIEDSDKKILVDIFPDGRFSKRLQRAGNSFGVFRDFSAIVRNTFLPAGYPLSVPPEYLRQAILSF